jgi:hypothetical protein
MTRRRRKPVGGGGARNSRSLANLKRGNSDPPIGNARAMTHGFRSEALVRDVEAEVRELMDALAESVPVRDPDGGLPAADTIAVEAAARALKRWRHVSVWCDAHGRFDPKTHAERPAAGYELRAESALHLCLNSLGMSPMARSKLGLNLARAQSFDLAREWQRDDEAIEGTTTDE